MTTNAELTARGAKVLMDNCRREPLVFTRGRGARLWDANGREYLDFVSGVAVNAFGHAPEFLANALAAQARQLMHVSNLYYSEPQITAAERLAGLAGMDRVFFCNSGSEAVESAIKLARKYGRVKLGGKFEIVTAERSFHGRTLGALTATGQEKYRRDFMPLVPGCRYAPYNDLAAWEAAITADTCALMVELIQAEGGLYPAEPEFVQGLACLAADRGLLLIFDEVQTCMGRTGKPFAWQHFGIKPDAMAVAKGIGGGFPVGALLAREEAAVFTPGDHQATFGGNPMAAAAVTACVDELQARVLPARAARLGAAIKETVAGWQAELPAVREVRGLGMLLGVEVQESAPRYVAQAKAKGLLLNAINERTIRLAPPLTIDEPDLEKGLAVLRDVLGC